MHIYLDIETIPTQLREVRAQIAETVTPPGNISKAESIEKWNAEKRPVAVREAIEQTALDGSAGHICCIGLAVDGADPASYVIDDIEREAEVLSRALSSIHIEGFNPPRIVGHNVINFDIRFLWQRAIVLGVRMPAWFPRDPKPWADDVFDTMAAFAGQRGTIGLDRLCRALGVPGKGDVDGSMIGQLWESGEYDRISEYCRADVVRTRAIHRRMQIAFGETSVMEAAE